jgi:hypothetical protein
MIGPKIWGLQFSRATNFGAELFGKCRDWQLQEVPAQPHDLNHTKAFTTQPQVLSFLVHVAWCAGCSCPCHVGSVAQVGAFYFLTLIWAAI